MFHSALTTLSYGLLGEERIYTIGEVSRILDCDERTVRHLIRSGSLRAFNISASSGPRARWRVRHSALIEFMSARQSTGLEPSSASLPSSRGQRRSKQAHRQGGFMELVERTRSKKSEK